MRANTLLSIVFGLLSLLTWSPSAAQNSGMMAVSVTVVNTCSFGRVNGCALPGTRIVAAQAGGPANVLQPGGAQATRQVIHL